MRHRAQNHSVVVACSGPRPEEFEDVIKEHPDLAAAIEIVGDLITDDEQSRFVTEADAIAITFNMAEQTSAFNRHSIASKALDALWSTQPVLIYGPPGTATVDWALKTGWSDVASTPDELDRFLRRLIEREPVNDRQLTARTEVRQEWTEDVVLERFESEMVGVAATQPDKATRSGSRLSTIHTRKRT
jgi:hypothetical protein